MAAFVNAGGTSDGVQGSTGSHNKNGVIGRNDDATARNAATPEGNGVFGFTQVPDGAGVFGAHASTGIGVGGLGLIGVSGGSVNGVGVMGVSAPPGLKGGDGVQGITNSEFRNGVYGRNDSTTKRGNGDPAGNGVLGFSQVPDGAGVLGAHGSTGVGVAGIGNVGISGASSKLVDRARDHRRRRIWHHRDRQHHRGLGHCEDHRLGRILFRPDQGGR